MLPALQALKDLHDLDQALLELEAALASERAGIASREGEAMAAEKALEAARGDLKEGRSQEKLKEMELKGLEEQILSWTVKLNTTRDNKDYQAIQHQIGTLKDQKGALEEQILGMMDQDATREVGTGEEEKRARAARAAFDAFRREAEAAMVKQVSEMGALKARRAAAAAGAPEDALSRYERIRAARKGTGLAAAADGSCQACHIALTPNQVNQLLQEKELVICQSCSRILYPL